MAINYGTTILTGDPDIENTLIASVDAKPGMLLEYVNVNGVSRLRPQTDSAATGISRIFAIDSLPCKVGINGTYLAGNLMHAAICHRGDNIWAWIPSGQNITNGDTLQSNGSSTPGTFKAIAGGEPLVKAMETTGAVTELTRLRVEVI